MKKVILTLLILFILGSASAAAYFYFSQNFDLSLAKKATPTPATPTITQTQPEALTPTSSVLSPTAAPTTTATSEIVQVQLQSDITGDTASSYYVTSVLLSTLGIVPSQDSKTISPDVSKYFDVYYLTSQNPYASRLNATYILALKNGTKLEPKDYVSSIATAKVSNLNLDKKYLVSGYCQTDSDCSVRTSACNYSAYNNYQQYIDVFGCTQANYPAEKADELQKLCKANEYPVLEYTGAKCVNNSCTPQGRTLKSCQAQI